MRILVLGGTVFLGAHFVEAALARGHHVTLFHRRRHGTELFPDVERIIGDRDGGIAPLEGARWDAVLDTSGYVPRVVGASARMLKGRCGHYVFVSSVSVYADLSAPGTDESAPVASLDDPTEEKITGETYGALKALCEQEVQAAFPESCLIVRPGLLVGPRDPTDRFTYWPVRYQSGGEALAPGRPDRPVQIIDARDLAEWLVRACERRTRGVYNAVGPRLPLRFGDMLKICNDAGGGRTTTTWVPDDFLLEAGVQPWTELPLWLPAEGDAAGQDAVDGRRAWDAGLVSRPLAETVADTLEWHTELPADREWRAGISREREAATLARWHASGERVAA